MQRFASQVFHAGRYLMARINIPDVFGHILAAVTGVASHSGSTDVSAQFVSILSHLNHDPRHFRCRAYRWRGFHPERGGSYSLPLVIPTP